MRVSNYMTEFVNRSNVNKNKVIMDKLNTQMATKKKIARPSDDPTIAIRALKYRGDLSAITQYYDRNVDDASAWLKATQDSIESTVDIVSLVKSEFVEGSNGTNTAESRRAILEQLEGLRRQIYENGNADYAGRYLFSGWRTSTKLTFDEKDLPAVYRNITEKLTADDIKDLTYVADKMSINTALSGKDNEQGVYASELKRFRLAYDKTAEIGSVTVKDVSGNDLAALPVITFDKASDDAYSPSDNQVHYIKETGELILGKDIADRFDGPYKNAYVEVVYDKEDWSVGDLRPEHYFDCELSLGLNEQITDYESLEKIVGEGNITKSGDFSEKVVGPLTGSMDKTYNPQGAATTTGNIENGKTYYSAFVDFASVDNLDKLNNTGFDSTCMTCNNHYSIQFVDSVDSSTVTANGYKYSFEPANNDYSLKIDLSSLKDNGVTGATLAKSIVEIADACFDFHYTQYGAEGSTLYIIDDRSLEDFRGHTPQKATFTTKPYVQTNPPRENLIKHDAQNKPITYDVTFEQDIQVNTYASQVYFHDMGRDIDELIRAIKDVDAADEKKAALEERLKDITLDETAKKEIQKTLDTAKKEYDLVYDKLQKMFEKGITDFGNYNDRIALAATEAGTRTQRLELVKDRLLGLKTTTEESASKNENVELTDIAVQLQESEKAYGEAMQAIGQISQQTLLSYI